MGKDSVEINIDLYSIYIFKLYNTLWEFELNNRLLNDFKCNYIYT